MTIRTTHTSALLELSPQAYAEIKAKLIEAGWTQALQDDGSIDMHGIAVTAAEETDDPVDGNALVTEMMCLAKARCKGQKAGIVVCAFLEKSTSILTNHPDSASARTAIAELARVAFENEPATIRKQ